jgi:hypothetical protein
VLCFLLGAVVLQAVFVGSTLALSRTLGARVSAASIGMPRLKTFQVGEMKLSLGALPLTGWVQFPGRALGDLERGPGTWRQLSLAVRLAITIVPWLAILSLAVLCIGPERAVRSIAHAVPQVLFVVDTTPLMRAFLQLLATAPISTVIGVMLAKSVTFNLLPIGSLAGSAVVHEIATTRLPAPSDEEEKPQVAWHVGSMIFLMVWIFGRFLWGLGHALLQP